MMVTVQDQEWLGRWLCARVGGIWHDSMTSIGLVEDGEMLAAAVFEGHSGPNIYVHIAVDDPRALRRLLRMIYRYVYKQLGCSRLTIAAEASNLAMVRLARRLGAVHEGTLVGASRSGDDILLSRLTADTQFWRRLDGQRTREKREQHSANPAEFIGVGTSTNGTQYLDV